MKRIVLLCVVLFGTVCGSAEAASAGEAAAWAGDDRPAERLNIIFDTDMGNDVDDALAMDMLYKYNRGIKPKHYSLGLKLNRVLAGEAAEGQEKAAGEGISRGSEGQQEAAGWLESGSDWGRSLRERRINLLAVMLNKEGDFPPRFIDLLNTWYGERHIPIGLSPRSGQSLVAGRNYTQVVCEASDDRGRPLYRHTIKDFSSLLPAVSLYRKLLAKADDASVTIVSVGFSTNLAMLLDSEPDAFSPLPGSDLVRKKVERLVMMAGNMENPTFAEYNVVNDVVSCQKVFREWPTPIVVSPFELGLQVRYPARSILEDFSWTKHHPIVDAYKAYLPQLEDRPTWDLTAVLFAIHPCGLFQVSPPGRIDVTDEGYTRFTPTPSGSHCYLSVTPEQAEEMRRYFVGIITSRPK